MHDIHFSNYQLSMAGFDSARGLSDTLSHLMSLLKDQLVQEDVFHWIEYFLEVIQESVLMPIESIDFKEQQRLLSKIRLELQDSVHAISFNEHPETEHAVKECLIHLHNATAQQTLLAIYLGLEVTKVIQHNPLAEQRLAIIAAPTYIADDCGREGLEIIGFIQSENDVLGLEALHDYFRAVQTKNIQLSISFESTLTHFNRALFELAKAGQMSLVGLLVHLYLHMIEHAEKN